MAQTGDFFPPNITLSQGHGRHETREVYPFAVTPESSGFPHAAQAAVKERSVMEFAEAKQKMFVLSGQAGLDLLDGIEQQVSDASSEWRMLADLPDDEGELLKDILCPGRDASAAADNLRKADGVSVRRLGFSLVLRNLEAIERDPDLDGAGYSSRFDKVGLVQRNRGSISSEQ